MAVIDDLNKLAAEPVVYLSRSFAETACTEVHRGRLHEALNDDWVFNASVGVNGILGFMLGTVDPSWASATSPGGGIQIFIRYQLLQNPPLYSDVVLSSVIPPDFAE